MPDKYDIAVIGGGPGGYVAAIRAAQLGAKVVLIEKDKLGGTCLNKGCIPTKAILACTNLYTRMLEARKYGISAENIKIDLKAVVERKNRIVLRITKGVEYLLKKNGVEVISGEGQFVEPGLIKVGNQEIRSKVAIFATGSSPASIPGISFDKEKFLCSDDILDLCHPPKKLCIVGGGVIGLHFAAIYSALGVPVDIHEALPEILPGIDEEVVKAVKTILNRKGVNVFTNSRFDPSKAAEKNLISVGRTPNTVGLDKVGLKLEKRAVVVNNKMETNLKGVYAVGDLTGIKMLAHVAYAQGIVAAENALGKDSKMDYSAIPVGIFTHPEIGSVGLTEQEAREKYGDDLQIGKFPMTALGIASAMGETEGFIKVLAEKGANKLVGVHILGLNATDLIGIASLALSNKMSIEQFSNVIYAHPTAPEGVYEAALAVAKKSLHFI